MAALVAQGCAEIRWLAGKMGAKPETLSAGPVVHSTVARSEAQTEVNHVLLIGLLVLNGLKLDELRRVNVVV